MRSKVPKPIRFHQAFDAGDVLDAATDAGQVVKKSGLWARFSPRTRFVIVAAAVSASLAGVAYIAFPEVFHDLFETVRPNALLVVIAASTVTGAVGSGPSPARRAGILFRGYASGSVPGPRFYHSMGMGATDAVVESSRMGRKVWQYIGAAGDIDVLSPSLGANRVRRFLNAVPADPAQPRIGALLPGGSGRLDDVVLIREGMFDAATGDGWGRFYYRGKHVDGTVVRYRPDGVTPRYNTFFPVGQTITGSGYTPFTLPRTMTVAQVDDLVGKAVREGPRIPKAGGGMDIIYEPHQYGIDEMVVEIMPDGGIASTYPVRGSAVWAWNPAVQARWVHVP